MGSAPRRGSSARRENKPANNNQTSEFNVKSRPLKECEMAIFARTEQQKAPRRKSSSHQRLGVLRRWHHSCFRICPKSHEG